jgi:hypothetical protein
MFLLRRLRPGEAGEGFHSFEGPLAGSTSSTAGAAPDSETPEDTIHLLGLQPYGRVWDGCHRFRLYSGGTVVQPLQSVNPIAIVHVH